MVIGTACCVYFRRYGRDSTVCVRKEEIPQYVVFIPLDKEEIRPQSTYIGRDETGSVYLPTQLERTLQLYW